MCSHDKILYGNKKWLLPHAQTWINITNIMLNRGDFTKKEGGKR